MPNPSDRPRLKNLWPFSKPRTPGFGISNRYYLSVLASVTRLPAIIEIVNPQGAEGAVAGFGAPLIGPTDKQALALPMERGVYAIASLDRKTVIKAMVMPKEEAGFDPEPLIKSAFAQSLSQETVTRIRATWTLIQMSFESHDPMVYPALDLLLDVAGLLSWRVEGVVADPMSQRYRLPNEVRSPLPLDAPIDARNFVGVTARMTDSGLHAYTLGLQKFSLPEIEISGLLPHQEPEATAFLIGLSQTVLLGERLEPGARVGAKASPFLVAEGGLDRGLWEGIPCLELIPAKAGTTGEALMAWQESGER